MRLIYNLLHIENPEKLLNEAYRILQPGGKLSIIRWKLEETPRGPYRKGRESGLKQVATGVSLW